MRARELMSSPVVTVRPEAPMKEVAERMAAHRVSGVPVVDERGQLLGIPLGIRRADLSLPREFI
jgi:CBS domain-containing protein